MLDEAMLSSQAPQDRKDKVLVRLTPTELSVLGKAARDKDASPEEFLRALFIEWFQKNWKSL